jgi:hypothetical protein
MRKPNQMKGLALLWLVVLAASLAAATGREGEAATECTPKTKTVGGQRATVFCGPAKAVVHMGGKTYSFSSGECTKQPGAFAVNIGTKTAKPTAGYSYLGLIAQGNNPGTYMGDKVSITFNVGRLHASLLAPGGSARPDTKVVLATRLRSGTFSGKNERGQRVTGSFTC